MTILEVSTTTESPSDVLRRLEVTLIWLWSVEPECSLEERPRLLGRLNAVSSRIDRLGLRHDAAPHDYIDVAELIVCRTELDSLCRRWPDPSASDVDDSHDEPMEVSR